MTITNLTESDIQKIYSDVIKHRVIEYKNKVKKDVEEMFDTDSLIKDYEIEYIFILGQIVLFENYPLNKILDVYSLYFDSDLSQLHIMKCIKYIQTNYNDLIEDYRKLNTTISFYRSALGYDSVEVQSKFVEWQVKGKRFNKLTPDKITTKHIQSDKDLMKLLINQYNILSNEQLADTSDLLLELLTNNKKK